MPSSRTLLALLACPLLGCASATTSGAGSSSPARPAVSARAALGMAMDSMFGQPMFRNANWGVLLVDPERGDTLYSRNAGKLFMPASNQKILTGAVALEQLGPDFRFRTAFATAGRVRGGVLEGSLVVIGRGDPTVSDVMRAGNAMDYFALVADSLAARGIRRIRGPITRAGDAFPDSSIGFGWGWDDLDYPYGAGVDELMFNEGFATITIVGAASGAVQVTTSPSRTVPDVQSELGRAPKRTAGDTARSRVQWTSVTWPMQRVVLTGRVFAGDTVRLNVALRSPGVQYLFALEEGLRAKGIVPGSPVYVEQKGVEGLTTLFTIESPPLRDILPVFEKPSQNQIGEILFRTLGLEKLGSGTEDSARRVVERQLVAWGADTAGFAVRDGSGLSRHDYVSPETIARVLDAMRRHRHFDVFLASLPIAGVDGTLARRMRGTPAERNVRAKTGTIDKARSLSGYVTTADGRMLIFSFLANNFTVPNREVEAVQDSILARVAAMRLAEP